MIRLFVALNISDEIKGEIISLRNKVIPNPSDYKWEKKEKLHLTLKFIGNVEEKLVDKIQNEMSFLPEYKPFNCSFSKFGFFYSGKIPKILWLGLRINDEIFGLVKRLNDKLVLYNIPGEKREFKPHLTILRVKKKLNKNFINSFENCKLPETKFITDSVSLVKSELLQGGSKYSEIKNFKLMGG